MSINNGAKKFMKELIIKDNIEKYLSVSKYINWKDNSILSKADEFKLKYADEVSLISYEKKKVRFFLLWGALNEQLQENTIKYCTDLSAQKIFVSQIPYFEGFYVQCENKGAMKTILERWKNENTTLKTAIEDFL